MDLELHFQVQGPGRPLGTRAQRSAAAAVTPPLQPGPADRQGPLLTPWLSDTGRLLRHP